MRPAFLADPALRRLMAVLPRARVVGGAVRDALAGRAVQDIDLATPEAPEDVMAALAAAGLRAVPTGIAHGTVTAVLAGRGFEVTTLRRDVTTDGRHAVVAFTDDWRMDAGRRDFTINAMSMDAAGELFDYFGGEMDLQAGIVRFVGDAQARVAEDYLRILRFFRFFARYGRGAADAAAMAAVRAGVGGLVVLSPERVWSEVKRILAAPAPGVAVALMRETGVLAAVLPGAGDLPEGLPPEPLLRLAAMCRGDVGVLAERFRMSGEERAFLQALREPAPEGDEASVRRALAEAPNAVVAGRLWLAGRRDLAAAVLAMERPVFPLRGRDLAGVAEGVALGERLRRVRQWWLDGGCVADFDACLARARLDG